VYTVQVEEIDDHNSVLQCNGIPTLPAREYLGLPPHELTQTEIAELIPAIQRIDPAIDKVMREVNQWIDEVPEEPASQPSEEHFQLVVEWTDFILHHLSTASTPAELIKLRQHVNNLPPEDDDWELTPVQRTVIIDAAFRQASLSAFQNRVNRLQDIRERFEQIEIVAMSIKDNTATSLYRQGRASAHSR